ncbi:hypothetical protein BV20DRAFT_203500 [Pilatotrama ljubarskyi]|nr:hypothetical protein BV20DRAFT_203500 [Pilatotrama ljubarskyi]
MDQLPGSRPLLVSIPTTSTSTSAGAASTGGFTFTIVPFTDTCATATLKWAYSGPAESFSLFASSASSLDEGADGVEVIGVPVVYGLPAASGTYTWSPVNLTAGMYIMHAVGEGIEAQSSQFQIGAGSDSSCLNAADSSQTNPPLATSSSIPVPPATSRSHTAAIAGGVVGGVVLLAVLAGILGYMRRGVHRPPSRRGSSGSRKEKLQYSKQWVGLSSVDTLPTHFSRSSTAVSGATDFKAPQLDTIRPPPSIPLADGAAPDLRYAETLSYGPGSVLPSRRSPGGISTSTSLRTLDIAVDPFQDGQNSSSSPVPGTRNLDSPTPSSTTSHMYPIRGSESGAGTFSREGHVGARF